MVSIFDAQPKKSITVSMRGKSIAVCGSSKAGKSYLCAQAPKCIFGMTENGVEALTGMVPIPLASWSDFTSFVAQLCQPRAKEMFSTVVIDSITQLVLLLDKYVGGRLSTEKTSLDFGSEADYGKGTKSIQQLLNIELQKLINQGYLVLCIVHTQKKTDFATQRQYIAPAVSDSVFGIVEKLVDEIIYLTKDPAAKDGVYKIYFDKTGGFSSAGGRFVPDTSFIDSTGAAFQKLEDAMLSAMKRTAEEQGAIVRTETLAEDTNRLAIVQPTKTMQELQAEFKELTDPLLDNPDSVAMITEITSEILGAGVKVRNLPVAKKELLQTVIDKIREKIAQ